jgi:acetyl esterase/lipase
MGHSAGAHIAAMVALDPQWLKAYGTDSSIIAGVIGLAGPYDFLPFTSDAARDALGHWPRPEETQPIHYARGDAPPMLLLSGDADTTVKPRNSKVLAQAISEKGGQAEVKLYPGVDHTDIIMAVSRPFRDKAPVIKDVIKFMEKSRR